MLFQRRTILCRHRIARSILTILRWNTTGMEISAKRLLYEVQRKALTMLQNVVLNN